MACDNLKHVHGVLVSYSNLYLYSELKVLVFAYMTDEGINIWLQPAHTHAMLHPKLYDCVGEKNPTLNACTRVS